MNLAQINPTRAFIAANENANQHNLTVVGGQTNGGTAGAKGSVWQALAIQRHIYFPAGASPTFTIGAAAGTGATIVKIPSVANDGLLPLTLTAGTSPSTGTLFTINFHVTFPAASIAAFFTPLDSKNAPIALQMMAPTAGSGTTLVVTNGIAPTASTAYQFVVWPIGLY